MPSSARGARSTSSTSRTRGGGDRPRDAPGGAAPLEYERRWCLDIAWTLVSSVTADAFGYGLRPAEARALVAGPWRTGVWVDYPWLPAAQALHRSRARHDARELRASRRAGLGNSRHHQPDAVSRPPPASAAQRAATAVPRAPLGRFPGRLLPRHAGYRRPRSGTRPQVVSLNWGNLAECHQRSRWLAGLPTNRLLVVCYLLIRVW
jgi:hypothetical protein